MITSRMKILGISAFAICAAAVGAGVWTTASAQTDPPATLYRIDSISMDSDGRLYLATTPQVTDVATCRFYGGDATEYVLKLLLAAQLSGRSVEISDLTSVSPCIFSRVVLPTGQ